MRHDDIDGAPAAPEPDGNAPGASGAREEPERPELDPDEGADAFETLENSRAGEHRSGAARDDEDHVSLDTPD